MDKIKTPQPKPMKIKRGPYRKYLTDKSSPIPKTTKWRAKQNSTFASSIDTNISGSSSPSTNPGLSQSSLFLSTDLTSDSSDLNSGTTSPNYSDIDPLSPYEHTEPDTESTSYDLNFSDSDSNSDLDSHCSNEEFSYATHDNHNLSDDSFSLNESLFEPLYEGAKITICGTFCAIMEYKRVCKLPFTAIEKLLELLQLVCPPGNSLPKSIYLLKSFFQKYSSQKNKQMFCPECSCEITLDKEKCTTSGCCGKDPNYLYTLQPEREIRNIVTRHWKKMDYSSKLTSDTIYDIHAGKGYKKELLHKPYTLGTIFNTDGIQPFKSSRISIWPLFLAFANLPPNIRMNRDNLVTVGVWVGSKPPMNILLKSLQQVMDRLLNNGFTIKLPNGTHTFHLYPLFGVFDLIAKAPALNMMQHNGSHGCLTCLHPGESYQRRRVYLPDCIYPARTHQSVMEAAAEALMSNNVIDGIKGESALASLVDLVNGIPVDYMHCVLEGVTKRLLEVWVKSYGRSMANVDKLLLQQQPPHEFSRPPRSILKHRKFWKASEFRNWLLYYSLPLLLDVLPPLYLHHYALLVCSMHILLQSKLKEVQIKAAEDMLVEFYELLPQLYGNVHCTLNSHLLIHLPKYVRLWGPLWTHSAFGFESLNGHVTSMIHSKYKIADQLLFSIEVSNTLALLTEKLREVESECTLEFLDLRSDCRRSNMSQLSPGTYSVGPLHSSTSEEEYVIIREFFRSQILVVEPVVQVHSFYRLYHNDTLYHSVKFGREGGKRNSTVCCYKEKSKQKVGIIQKFALCSDSVSLALITPFEASLSLLKNIGNPGRDALRTISDVDLLSVFIFPVKKQLLLPLCAVPVTNLLCKCVLISYNTVDYVIKIPNNFEHH